MISSPSPRHSYSSNGEEESPSFFDSKAKKASAGPMLKLFSIVIPSNCAKTLLVTSSASISITVKVASVSSTTISFLSHPKFRGSEKNAIKKDKAYIQVTLVKFHSEDIGYICV
ncbi:hypothetical protein Goari_024989 [Gossypium aridum]|uniref:Uncharacterized protein n=1 Tax=Gossypium aridum TaxID=34290 RepID=A0A7J8X7Z3_GOSAI|nr:hypothetical protein [Gossypium aridum]